MKKSFLSIVFFVLFFSSTFGQQFIPTTVQSMDATITMNASGSFSGTVSNVDTMEIKFLVFESNQNQEVLEHTEELTISGKTLSPTYVFEGENKYAVFKLEDLTQHAQNPVFQISSVTRIKTSSQIGLVEKSLEQENLQTYLAPSDYIESNDPTLISKAEIEFSSNDSLENVKQIAQWVNTNIEYDFENYYDGVFSAKQTYESRAGVCDEFANISAAFTRIKGIPTRYVTGISFDGTRFGNHGWLEVYLNDFGWLGLDSTFGEAGFVDGAHFVLGKTTDANDLANLRVTTQTLDPISVNTLLELPKVQINSVEFFEKITSVSTQSPTKVLSKQSFTITATIKNELEANALIPIELALHDDFSSDEKLKLENFKAGEEKTVTWSLIAPSHTDKKTFLKYDALVLTPDQNKTIKLEVHAGKTIEQTPAQISFFDISPRLENNTLFIDVQVENTGSVDGGFLLSAFFEDEKKDEIILTAKAFSVATHTLEVKDFEFGEVNIELKSDFEEKKINVFVPQKKEDPIQIIEEKVETTLPTQTIVSITPESTIIILAAGGGLLAIVLAGTVLYFLTKKN